MSTRQITITRTFDAPRDTIWQAWTDPAFAATWWHPADFTTPRDSVRVDLREGGEYAYTMVSPDGTAYPTGGSYLEVREPERLRFTWREAGNGDEAAPVITVELEETDEGRRTTMTFHLAELDEDRAGVEDVRSGWSQSFDELDAALASRGVAS